jgi:hypothetical protein
LAIIDILEDLTAGELFLLFHKKGGLLAGCVAFSIDDPICTKASQVISSVVLFYSSKHIYMVILLKYSYLWDESTEVIVSEIKFYLGNHICSAILLSRSYL